MLTLTWHGHACFELNSDRGNIVFDPYEEGYVTGLTMPHLRANALISSHRHHDHYAPEMVTLSGESPFSTIQQIPCFHDEECGKKRGNNLISVVEIDGLRVCHMGDIGHIPSAEQFSEIGKLDILMIPVGGFYTVDAVSAKAICDELIPKVVIPMHYKGEGKGLQNVAPVEDFLRLFPAGDVFFSDKGTLSCEEILRHGVCVFPWP